jgi:hypothetical protein
MHKPMGVLRAFKSIFAHFGHSGKTAESYTQASQINVGNVADLGISPEPTQ